MRHIVLALMIALLPLRGWAGDVMATQMAASAISIEAIVIKTGVVNAHEMGQKGSFAHQKQNFESSNASSDCHEQLGVHPDTVNASNTEHCATCPACQVCHTVALSPQSLNKTISFTASQAGPTSASTFTSADTALGQKPPIA